MSDFLIVFYFKSVNFKALIGLFSTKKIKEYTFMNKTLFACVLVATATSCIDMQEDLYTGEDLKTTDTSFSFLVPNSFDWSLFKTAKLTVTMGEEGNTLYGLEIYADSILIEKGVLSSSTPFSVPLQLLKDTQELTIMRKDANGKSEIRCVAVTGNTINCVFDTNELSLTTKAIKRTSIPSNAIAIKNGQKLKAGGTYYVEQGKTCSNVQLSQNVKVYVAGTLQLGNYTQWNDVELYITPTGEVSGYSISAYDLYLENEGRLLLSSGMYLNQSEIVNNGFLSMDHGLLDISDCIILNNHTLHVSELTARRYDQITTNGKFLARSKAYMSYGTLTIGEGGMFRTNYADMQSSKINLEPLSKLLCDIHFVSTGTTMQNTTDEDYAIALTAYLQMDNRNAAGGKIGFDVNTNVSYGAWTDENVVDSRAALAEVVVPATPFNANGYNSDKVVEPDAEVVYTGTSYSVVMEDNFPIIDDMDMNDLVCDWNYGTQKDNKNKIVKSGLRFTLKAIGASKQLAAAIRLNNFDKNKIKSVKLSKEHAFGKYFELEANGTERGVAGVIIPLFEDAHTFFTENKEFINTDTYSQNPYSFEVEIEYTEPIEASEVTVNDVEFFAVIDGDTEKRTEIHLFQNSVTSKAENKTYFSNPDQVWGLQFTGNFRYPKESVSITTAYPHFSKWVQSGGSTDTKWYNEPEETKVINFEIN